MAGGTLQPAQLHLHPERTRIAAINEGFDFLGYDCFRDKQGRLEKVVGRKSRQRFGNEIPKRTECDGGQKHPKVKRSTVAQDPLQ